MLSLSQLLINPLYTTVSAPHNMADRQVGGEQTRTKRRANIGLKFIMWTQTQRQWDEVFLPPSGHILINAALRKGLVRQHVTHSNRELDNKTDNK